MSVSLMRGGDAHVAAPCSFGSARRCCRHRVLLPFRRNPAPPDTRMKLKTERSPSRTAQGPGLAGELLKVFGFYVAEQLYEEAELWGREMVSFREKLHGDKWFTFTTKQDGVNRPLNAGTGPPARDFA